MKSSYHYFCQAASVWDLYFKGRIGALDRDRQLDHLYHFHFDRSR